MFLCIFLTCFYCFTWLMPRHRRTQLESWRSRSPLPNRREHWPIEGNRLQSAGLTRSALCPGKPKSCNPSGRSGLKKPFILTRKILSFSWNSKKNTQTEKFKVFTQQLCSRLFCATFLRFMKPNWIEESKRLRKCFSGSWARVSSVQTWRS